MGHGAAVTLFFTDIEDSTALWDEFPDLMSDALSRHRAIVVDAVENCGGTMVKDTGDGVFAVFSLPRSALDASIVVQATLSGADWGPIGALRVRVGIHTGEAEAKNGDYYGPAVNLAARVMSAAHGGQVFVSDEALRAGAAVEGCWFEDLGLHRVKGIGRAVRLHQLCHPALEQRFPPPRTLDGLPNNLPTDLSPFIGREAEIDEVADLLGGARLVTLTGAGGSGKTRLALRVGAEVLERFRDGVWFVDLAGLGEATLVPRAVAAALGVGDQPGRTWTEAVRRFLLDRRVLLVIDNCEHLLDGVAHLVGSVLEACPEVKTLATSRESLNLPGEVTWRVPSMTVPPEASETTADLENCEAGRLFLERARAARPGFEPSTAEIGALAEICRRLDGLPLGLELAAARLKALSPTELARHLDDRFRLLVGGTRSALARQRTLEATVAWSYHLLDEDERTLFDRLSVFAGTFTLEAAEHLCDGADVDVLNGIFSLAEKSLLETATAGDFTRYRMLETLRAYGRERLADSGVGGAVRDAHTAWAADLAHRAGEKLDGPEQSEWLTRVEDDLDNFRSAMQWAVETDQTTPGLVIAASLYRYWFSRAVREGREWLDRLLEHQSDTPPEVLGPALFAHGSLLQVSGDHEASAARIEPALAAYEASGDELGRAWALHHLGRAQWGLGDLPAAAENLRRSLEIFRSLDHPFGLAMALLFARGLEMYFGNMDVARQMNEELEERARHVGSPAILAHVDEFTGVQWSMTGDFGPGAPYLHAALERYRDIGNRVCIAHCLENSAHLAAGAGRPLEATRLLGATDALRDEAGVPVPPWENVLYEEAVERCRKVLDDDELAVARADGEALTLDAAVELALVVTKGAGSDRTSK